MAQKLEIGRKVAPKNRPWRRLVGLLVGEAHRVEVLPMSVTGVANSNPEVIWASVRGKMPRPIVRECLPSAKERVVAAHRRSRGPGVTAAAYAGKSPRRHDGAGGRPQLLSAETCRRLTRPTAGPSADNPRPADRQHRAADLLTGELAGGHCGHQSATPSDAS